ncbi:MAG: CoA-binding protein, partial [Conexibacter sp.]|nr:CoA-binding protein [Conexibacter sp.]
MITGMDEAVRDLLTTTRTWAVVGCSPDPGRDSHRIAALLQERGFRIVPVNPAAEEILGERCYPSVTAIPRDVGVEVVDVFRRSDAAGRHVDEA